MVLFPSEDCKAGEGTEDGPLAWKIKRFNKFIDEHQGLLCKSGLAMAARVWVTMWKFEYGKDGTTKVGTRKLAARLGTTPSSVHRAMNDLYLLGFFVVLVPGTQGRNGQCATYELRLPEIGVVEAKIPGIAELRREYKEACEKERAQK